MDFFQASAALAMVACRTGGHHVRPDVLASLVARLDVINRETPIATAAVLAGIIVPPEDFPTRQLDPRAGPMDLLFEPYDAGAGQQARHCPDMPAAVDNQTSLPCQDKTDGPPCGADIKRLEIRVEDKDRLIHGASIMGMIILLFARVRRVAVREADAPTSLIK
jgi:hypothetical protein